MLGWLCIVQSLRAYTPGVRAGLNVGLPPHQARRLEVSRAQSLHDAATLTTDDLHWGYAPNPFKNSFYILKGRFLYKLKDANPLILRKGK